MSVVSELNRVPTDETTSCVRRTAFYLESQRQPLFAWLHHSWEGNFDHGVIICPPIGHEQLHAHRSLRHLAEELACAKVPVLRLDWHGTGDSSGVDEDPERYSMWLANVRDATLWMREQLGCRQISLIGLRTGALLAAMATAEIDIDNLVLWAPVTKGRACVREMKAIGLTAETPSRSRSDSSADIEAAGFVLSSETAAGLSQLDLLQSRPASRRALVVSRDDLPEDRRLFDHLSDFLQADQISVPGFAEMMAEPHRSQVPARAIREITAWLVEKISSESSSDKWIDTSPPCPTTMTMRCGTGPEARAEGKQSIRESVHRIASHPDLFGIVSEPVSPRESDLPLIVLLNAGSSYRIGPGRLNVHLARQLAVQGFRCLRMDLCGLGDSIASRGEGENDPYAATIFRDIDLTLRDAERRFAAKRIVLMGLCSGAYAAFQTAAQITNDSPLVESVLINPLTFFWREGMTLDDSPTKQLLTLHYYAGAALEPRKWLKLLSGKTKIGIFGAAKLLAKRLKRLAPSRRAIAINSHEMMPQTAISHPRREDIPGDLDRIARAGRDLTMFFSRSDPGYSILTAQAGRVANRLRRTGKLNVSFIDDADHTFSQRVPRQKLIHAISDHLCRRYQALPRG